MEGVIETDEKSLDGQQVFDENVLFKSLTSIDDLIDKNGVDIMKLSMRSELTQAEMEGAKSPSDLAHCLMKSHYSEPSILLARFLYALKILGHRRYGYRAMRRIYSIINECIDHPPAIQSSSDIKFEIEAHVNVDKNTFLLNQYLATACRLIPPKCCESFILYCAKQLGHNPEKYSTPCEVITKMLEQQIISPDNHLEFMEDALITAGVSERVLQEYQDLCTKSDSFRPRTRSTSQSSDRAHGINISRTTTNSQLATEGTHSRTNSVRSRLAKLTSESPTNDLLLSAHPRTEPEPDTEEEPANKKRCSQASYISIGLGTLACCTLLLFCLVLALQVSYAIEGNRANKPTVLLLHENSSVILTEANHLLTASLEVTEDTRHVGDYQRDVEVYQLVAPCTSIPSRKATPPSAGITNISSVNGTTFYALADSVANFSICGKTNTTPPDIERLELVVYKDSIHIVTDFFHVGTGDDWLCKESSIHLTEPGYYTFTFLPPTHEAQFTFNATYDLHGIDTEQLQGQAAANYTLNADQDSHVFPLTFGATHSCFVAVVKDNTNTPKENVHVRLHFDHQRSGHIIGGVLIAIAVVVIMIVAVASVYIKHNSVSSTKSKETIV